MSVGDRVTRALTEEADSVDVDLDDLHAAMRGRLPGRAPGARVVRPLLVALSVAAVLLGAVAVGHRLLATPGPAPTAPDGVSQRGGVESSFRCRVRDTLNLTRPTSEDSFIPSLQNGPAGFATAMDAPRYDYLQQGDRATLLLGNANGSLASRSTFTRSPDGRFDVVRAVRCTGADGGILVPDRRPRRLEQRADSPYPAAGMADNPRTAVLVDDRSYYDVAGLTRHRSIYASLCGPAAAHHVCVASGRPTGFSVFTGLAGTKPVEITSVFLPRDDTVRTRSAYRLWLLVDRTDAVRRVTAQAWRMGDGGSAQVFSGPGRGRTRAFLLVSGQGIHSFTVSFRDGTVRHYGVSRGG